MKFRSLNFLSFRVILPDISQTVPVDSAQLDMRNLTARNENPVGPHRHLAHGLPAAGQVSSSRNRVLSFAARLFHHPPIPRLGERTGLGIDPSFVFPGEHQHLFHGQGLFLDCQLDSPRIAQA